MVLGSIWYGPLLFARPWMRLIGKNMDQIKGEMKQRNMPAVYFTTFVTALVQAFVLGLFVNYMNVHAPWDGLALAFWVSLGFVLTGNLSSTLFENRPIKLYVINNGYTVVQLLISGLILASWR